jgi:hypothetical protein
MRIIVHEIMQHSSYMRSGCPKWLHLAKALQLVHTWQNNAGKTQEYFNINKVF